MYAEYIDDEKTAIKNSVKNCLKFDCPLAFINNKEDFKTKYVFRFFDLGSILCLYNEKMHIR